MAIHSSILAWKILQTEELGGLQSMGLQRLRHDYIHTQTNRCTDVYTVILYVCCAIMFYKYNTTRYKL